MRGFYTGFPSLDDGLSFGLLGLVEIYGESSSGKSLMAASIGAETGGTGLYVDLDRSNDPKAIGRIAGDCMHTYPSSGEVAVETAYSALRSGVRYIIFDSTPNMVPFAEANSLVGEREMNAQNRLLYHGLSTLSAASKRLNAIVIVVSDVRVNIKKGRIQSSMERISAPLSDFRIFMKRKSLETDLGVMKETRVTARVSGRNAELAESDLLILPLPAGLSKGMDRLKFLMQRGMVTRSGAWFYLDGIRLGMGKQASAKKLEGFSPKDILEMV